MCGINIHSEDVIMLKKYLPLLCLQGLMFGTAFAAGQSVVDTPDIPNYPLVLEYHQICPVAHNDLDVSVENFTKELDWLEAKGYRALSMARFIEAFDQHKALPPKSVLITFDDGYKGVYDYALPELRKRYMHATLFLVTDSIGKQSKTYPRITAEEVKKMGQDYLVDIGSHTTEHDWLTKLLPDKQKYEIVHSKEVLEKLTGKPCDSISYPYGDFNSLVIANVKAAGYKIAFAGYEDSYASHIKRYTVPRMYIGRDVEKHNFKIFKETLD
jgi:peptidoglycan/xylan/chitin deacetylase (PgdA/CDA1 family)